MTAVPVNPPDLPVSDITEQMLEIRPLPMGRAAFEEWSDRIISGALLPCAGDEQIFREGQKFALASSLIHLGPTESHKPDAYFIHTLRKYAINQVAHEISQELKTAAQKRLGIDPDAKPDLKVVPEEK